jgi:MarR family transcriptional regulator, transcriptional regulator for hemolysin
MTPDDEHYIGYTITDVARLMRTVFERRVRAVGLTRAQWLVIARVHRHPGLSQSEVADLLEIEKASAGRLIDRMEAKGWLKRRADGNDRRINRLHLTPTAERLHGAVWPIAEATVDDALDDLSVEERRRLTRLMTRVKSKLQALVERDPAMNAMPTSAGSKEDEDREAQAL